MVRGLKVISNLSEEVGDLVECFFPPIEQHGTNAHVSRHCASVSRMVIFSALRLAIQEAGDQSWAYNVNRVSFVSFACT